MVAWFWREDGKSRQKFSKAIWIPFIWLLILATHPLSWWFSFFLGISSGGSSDLDGNPVNRLFYSSLIIVSIIVVSRRRVSWGAVIRSNPGLAIFFGYLALTVLWADYPFPTIKRWIKEVGAIPVLLVMLTEAEPIEAITFVFTRCAFIIFPYSVLAIKYIPEIGRSYGRSGGLQVVGICEQKNSLGEIVTACSLIIGWQLVQRLGTQPWRMHKAPVLQWVLTLGMGFWLLHQCDSKTSLLCLMLGGAIILSTKVALLARRPRWVVATCLVAVPLFLLLDNLVGVSKPLLALLGRDPTLTNRTNIWAAVREHPVNPLLGCGFLNYWDMLGSIDVSGYDVELKTAHNGYLEVYLDGGMLGLVALAVMLVQVGRVQARRFCNRVPSAGLMLALFSATLLANVSESLYARRTPLWVCCILVSLFGSIKRSGETEEGATAGLSTEDASRLRRRPAIALTQHYYPRASSRPV